MVLELLWSLGWIYVPGRDAAPFIWPEVKLVEVMEAEAIRKAFERFRRFDGESGSPDYRAPSYSADGAVWDRRKWFISGADGADWGADGSVSLSIGDSTQRKNYMLVRPLVCMGWPASKIATHYGKSIRWAEELVAAVRESFWIRFQQDPFVVEDSPTDDSPQFAGESPQITPISAPPYPIGEGFKPLKKRYGPIASVQRVKGL